MYSDKRSIYTPSLGSGWQNEFENETEPDINVLVANSLKFSENYSLACGTSFTKPYITNHNEKEEAN